MLSPLPVGIFEATAVPAIHVSPRLGGPGERKRRS
jgi:hypothetical protein